MALLGITRSKVDVNMFTIGNNTASSVIAFIKRLLNNNKVFKTQFSFKRYLISKLSRVLPLVRVNNVVNEMHPGTELSATTVSARFFSSLLERLLNAEPWVEREVKSPLSRCNLGVLSGARRSNHT